MGLFDRLLKTGMRAVGDAVVDAVSDAIREKSEPTASTWNNTAGHREAGPREPKQVKIVERVVTEEEDEREFDEKLAEILPELGEYEVRREVSPDELEQEAGHEIYTRERRRREPNNFTYVLYQNGERVLIINFWSDYETYAHYANRDIREYCRSNGIKMLDFFEYLPNREDYMSQRISAQL